MRIKNQNMRMKFNFLPKKFNSSFFTVLIVFLFFSYDINAQSFEADSVITCQYEIHKLFTHQGIIYREKLSPGMVNPRQDAGISFTKATGWIYY